MSARLLDVSLWVYAQSTGDGGVQVHLHNEEAEARAHAEGDTEPFCDNVFPLDLVIDTVTRRAYTRADRIYAERQGVPIEHSRRLRDFSYLSGDATRSDEEETRVHRLAEELRAAGITHGWPIVPRQVPKRRKGPTR